MIYYKGPPSYDKVRLPRICGMIPPRSHASRWPRWLYRRDHSNHAMLEIFKIERMDVRLQVLIELSPSRLTFQAPTVRKKCSEVALPRDISIHFRPSSILLVLDLVSSIETFLHPLAE